MSTNYSALLHDAASLYCAGHLRKAENAYRAALQIRPKAFLALYHLGLIKAQLGDPGSAIPFFRAALEEQVRPDILNNLGLALSRLQHYREAAEAFSKAISLEPRYAMAHNNLGLALDRLNLPHRAVESFARALALRQDFIEALNNTGAVYLRLGDPANAMEHLRKAVALRPSFTEAQVNLARALISQDRCAEALSSCFSAKRTASRKVDILRQLGDLFSALDHPIEALECYEAAVCADSSCVDARLQLGLLLQTLGRHQCAINHYRLALNEDPRSLTALDALGSALAEIGDDVGAREVYEESLKLAPMRPRTFFALMHTTRVSQGDSILASVRQLACQDDVLTSGDRVIIHFALAKGLMDIGDHDAAFNELLIGNALKRKDLTYDEPATLSRFKSAEAFFSREFIVRHQGHGHPSYKPIFILGMMRSGSTLVEQLLACHPQVFAGGERRDFQDVVAEVLHSERDIFGHPDLFAKLTASQLQEIGERYLSRLAIAESLAREPPARKGLQAAVRITDKLPANFFFVGLIHLVFPNATIIHTRRDPIDTCLSCFSSLFANLQPHTYELSELGRYYRGYSTLMSHWRRVLPPGALIEVQYEQLVANFEAEVHRLLVSCGLDWDEACLEFYRSKRPVRTASMRQVRQPIYRTSVRRVRPAPDLLSPLASALGEEKESPE